ncbi:MAG: competence/damage-inducible protein A [Deltaproteobacteria bacterium]
MNSEIIAVGTELLMGQIANTNAQYISRKLAEYGVNMYYHSTVGDNAERMLEILRLAFKRSDLIILTGGLGPTSDDITKETVAEFLGLDMKIHDESEQRIREYVFKAGREFAESNLKQAMIPVGAQVLKNNYGTAPGVVIEKEGRMIVLLPGPPREMIPMFNSFAEKYLSINNSIIYSKYIKLFGIPEAQVEEAIKDLVEGQPNPTVAPYVGDGELTLRVTTRASNISEAEKFVMPVVQDICSRFNEHVFSIEGEKLEKVVVTLLKNSGKKLVAAESCTGGMIASRITSIPGASQVFDRGVVTYSNESKTELIGVKKETLEKYGAVSKETAYEMAKGVREAARADIGVAVTGIAGPSGGSEEKPVGLVYIGLADEKGVDTYEFRFNGDRERIRLLSTMNALNLVRKRCSKD